MAKDSKSSPDRDLADKITGLFDEYDMPTIGLALAVVFGTYVAKSELESGNGDRILEAMLRGCQSMGQQGIDKIKAIQESSPEKIKEFMDRITQQYH